MGTIRARVRFWNQNGIMTEIISCDIRMWIVNGFNYVQHDKITNSMCGCPNTSQQCAQHETHMSHYAGTVFIICTCILWPTHDWTSTSTYTLRQTNTHSHTLSGNALNIKQACVRVKLRRITHHLAWCKHDYMLVWFMEQTSAHTPARSTQLGANSGHARNYANELYVAKTQNNSHQMLLFFDSNPICIEQTVTLTHTCG